MSAERHTTEQAPGKPLSAPESASTPTVGVSGGFGPLTEPQTGADGFQGEPEPRGPVDWARQQAAERATARVFAALHRSAEEDVNRVIQLAEQWASRPERADALRELTDALGYNQLAHNAGPSVRECAQADAAHWNDKYAGEGQ